MDNFARIQTLNVWIIFLVCAKFLLEIIFEHKVFGY